MNNEEYTAALLVLKKHCRLMPDFPAELLLRNLDLVNLDDCTAGVWKEKGISAELQEAGKKLQAVLPVTLGPEVPRLAVNRMAVLLAFCASTKWSVTVWESHEKKRRAAAKELHVALADLQAPAWDMLANKTGLNEPGGLDRLLQATKGYPNDKACFRLAAALTSLGAEGRRELRFSCFGADTAIDTLKDGALRYAIAPRSRADALKDCFYKNCLRTYVALDGDPTPTGVAWTRFSEKIRELIGLPPYICKKSTVRIMGRSKTDRDNWLLLERLQVFCVLTETQKEVCEVAQRRLAGL